MFITKKVFDPALLGKAAELKGTSAEGRHLNRTILVTKVDGENIETIDRYGEINVFQLKEFEVKGGLRLTVLSIPDKQQSKRRTVTKGFTRIPRTKEQIRNDNTEIERILFENGEPMRLASLLKLMRKSGHKHWTTNNASGFVKFAIDAGRNVVKVEKGVYSYWWADEKGNAAVTDLEKEFIDSLADKKDGE